jgi:hypothetical protein
MSTIIISPDIAFLESKQASVLIMLINNYDSLLALYNGSPELY